MQQQFSRICPHINNKYVIINPNFPHIHKSHQLPQICRRSLSENRHIKIQFCPARSILTTTTTTYSLFLLYFFEAYSSQRAKFPSAIAAICDCMAIECAKRETTESQFAKLAKFELMDLRRQRRDADAVSCLGMAVFDARTGRFERFLIKLNRSYRQQMLL